MRNSVHYKGFIGEVEFSEEDKILSGNIVGLKEALSFSGDSVSALIADFHRAVDGYLAECERTGREPEKPYKGSFNVRIKPDLHREAAMIASDRNMSLNSFVEESIKLNVESELAKRGHTARRVIGVMSER